MGSQRGHGWQRRVCASCEQLRRAEATPFGGDGQKVSKFSRKPLKGTSDAFLRQERPISMADRPYGDVDTYIDLQWCAMRAGMGAGCVGNC